jgi:trypsin
MLHPKETHHHTMSRLIKLTLALVAAAFARAQDGGGDPNEIVGGTEVEMDSVPWMGSLETVRGTHFCGGSLIHRKVVVTAAHCVENGVANFVVRFGTTDLASDRGTRVYVKKIFLHPQYNEDSFTNDIAMIELQHDAYGIPYIKMDTSTNDWQSGSARVLGWGRTSGSGSKPKQLRYADIPITSDNECKKRKPFDTLLRSSQVCAGYADGRSGACVGDSGGPLTVGTTLVGLTSYGERGCGTYVAYTQLNKYQSFISDTLGKIITKAPETPESPGFGPCRCDATGVDIGTYCANWLSREFNWCYSDYDCIGGTRSPTYLGKYWFKCLPGRSAIAQMLDDGNRNGNIYMEPSDVEKEFGSTLTSEAKSSDIGAVAGGAIGAGVVGLGCAVLLVAQRKRNNAITLDMDAAHAQHFASQSKMETSNRTFEM